MKIDVTFNFQAETEPLDADRYSSILQEYHKVLWSKPLPNGKVFELTKIGNNRLLHKSDLGEFCLSSDRAVATFSRWKKLEHIIVQMPKEKIDNFCQITDTIGGIVIWPSNQVENRPTINASRGFNRNICDRLDLTIECIRRYYLGQKSPLFETLKRYDSFFDLFRNFKGYIDFFLLQDAVSSSYTSVRIAPPFNNFETIPLPSTVDEYKQYMEDTENFVKARNNRMLS